ncbi:DUF4279 domain-containing protein [Geobacter anodireducens]|uniref:DUF4279 domain-containing protein n=1 Tax=Geobacter soli TaxID=1510391 RepID=UPI000AF2EDBE|nr:DUF4279 domain-containing protein [Geobacter soli]
MSARSDEVYVSLCIWSKEIPSKDITQILGITPDSTRDIGDIIRPGIISDTYFWEINSKEADNVHLATHVKSIINFIKPNIDNFSKLGKARIWLSCAMYVNQGPSAPSVHFDTESLTFLSKINAEIDVDIYCMGSCNTLE